MEDVKKAVAAEMEKYFGGDKRRIEHAHKVTAYAEDLLKTESADPVIVIAAGLLHDIGIRQAEKKYGSTGGKFQEIEGPPIAREILERLSFAPAQTDEICLIIANHHSPGKVNSPNFKVLFDADWLVNIADEYDIHDKTKLRTIIDRVFLTHSGKSLARKIYLGE